MSAVRKFRGFDYMPIKLKGLLVEHGISQTEFAAAVRFPNGRAVSRTTVSLIMNWGYYPKGVPEDYMREQIVVFLRRRGFDEADIAAAFDTDPNDYRNVPARGAHLPPPHEDGSATGPAPQKPPRRRKPDHEEPARPEFEPMEVEMLSPAAKRHFKIFRDPFQDDVNSPEDVYLSEDQRYVLEAMLQTAKAGGITAVIGESGSGKTTLRKLLQHRIAREGQTIRLIFPHTLDKTKLSTGSICTAIVKDIEPDTTVRSSLEAQARQVKEVLLRSARAGFKHMLMIEEAHDLSVQTLKYLKRFHEIEGDDGFGKVLSIVLVAQPEMRVKLNVARYPEAREFINRCEVATLAPLYDNLKQYVTHKFERVGIAAETIITDDAYIAIRERWTKIDPSSLAVRNDLYPLIINNTITRALNRAAELGAPLVSGVLVKEL